MIERLRPILPYLARYRRYYIFGFFTIAIANALALLAPLVLRRAVNRIDNGASPEELLADALLIIGLAVGSGVFRFLMRRSIIWASRKIGYDLRGDLFTHVIKLDGPFFDRTPTGDIITRATSDIDQVRMLVGPAIMQGLNASLVALVAIPLMINLDVRLAVYAFAPLPLLAVATNLLGQIAHRRSLAVQESFSRLSASVQESLAGIRVIKAFSREDDRGRRFRQDSTEYFGLNMHLIKLWGAFVPLMTMLSGTALVLVLYFGGKGYMDGRIDLGKLVAFMFFLSMLIWPMIAFGWVISLYQRGTASLRRLREIFETSPTVVDPTEAAGGPLTQGSSLEFNHLTFSYNDGAALSGISAIISPGETVAIAGPTGSGKSTLAGILWRRYPIETSMLFMGGIDANRIPVQEWRSRIAMVPQESFLFSQSLKRNIAFGAGDLSDSRLADVSRVAAFEKDVRSFPGGYETVVGERGITLSGGQKQRAAIARALAMDAEILVLDDAFSAVDAQTEKEILDALSDLFGSRIIIMITHRIATLRRVDRVLFLERGQLADSGTHQEMVDRGGAYARWAERETLREELERM
jgi:ATP-binding cassette subfamily B protein